MIRLSRPSRRWLSLLVGVAIGLSSSSTAAAQEPRAVQEPRAAAPVRLEIVMEPGFDAADAHRWARELTDAGIDARVRSMRVGDDAQIKNVGSEANPSYVVVGILSARQQLMLPGRNFGITQAAAIKQFLAELSASGPDAVTGERLAFGLTPAQLLALHDDLGNTVSLSTRGTTLRDVVDRIAGEIRTPVSIDADAAAALEDALICEDELQGMTIGTALAAAVRPAGLVVDVRRDETAAVRLTIVDSRRVEEFWPIGWPIEDPPIAVAPVLSDKIKVDIKAFRLRQALDAIQVKCDMPFLYDHNGLAEQGIDLGETRVSYSHPEAPYSAILSRLLGQTEPSLRYEIRMDENDSPFLWISPR